MKQESSPQTAAPRVTNKRPHHEVMADRFEPAGGDVSLSSRVPNLIPSLTAGARSWGAVVPEGARRFSS